MNEELLLLAMKIVLGLIFVLIAVLVRELLLLIEMMEKENKNEDTNGKVQEVERPDKQRE